MYLKDIKLLEHVFYRFTPVLEYISLHENMSDLDKEAIMATIMDALVTNSIIDASFDALDFNNLKIVRSTSDEYYHYEKYPFVMGFPLWMKEKMRLKCIHGTGGIPISLFMFMPPGTSRCVYDMNYAISSIFDDATFFIGEYVSPTREGVIAKNRPFVEVSIDETNYLLDTLTKRMFKSDEFASRFNLKRTDEVTISKLKNKEKLKMIKEIYKEFKTLSDYFVFTAPMMSVIQAPEGKEYLYELELAKQNFKEDYDASILLAQELAKKDINDMNQKLIKSIFSNKN